MMDKNMKIAVVLSAYDKMSTVINSAVDRVQRKMQVLKKFGKDLGRIGDQSLMAGAVGVGLFAGAIKSAADMEKMQVALTTAFQGNKAASEAAFASINKFAAKTPYEVGEVMTAFIKLKNMGLDPSEQALTAYGNTASAMGKDLNMMIEAVADAATGEFERLKEFGIRSKSEGNRVTFTFQNQKTTVGKNAKEIEGYLKKIGLVKFAGGIEAQSKTLHGQMSTLKDSFTMAAAGIGKMFIPHLNKLFKAAGPVIEKIGQWVQNNPKFIKVLAVTTAALLVVGAAAKLLSIILTTNPIIFIITGIAAAATLIYLNWGKISAWFSRMWDNVKKIFSKALTFLKSLFLNFTPHGLVIQHWSKIVGAFHNIWERVKEKFNGFFAFVRAIPSKMVQMGRDIINGIWTGLKQKWEEVQQWFANKMNWVDKIAQYWDPQAEMRVKVRKLHEVTHKVNAGRPNPAGQVVPAVAAVPATPRPVANQSKSVFQFSPVINYSGAGGPQDAQHLTGLLKNDFAKQMAAYEQQQQRKRF